MTSLSGEIIVARAARGIAEGSQWELDTLRMTKVCMMVLMGLPAVGKSSLCSRLKREVRTMDIEMDVVHVAFDELVSVEHVENAKMKETRKLMFINVIEKLIQHVLTEEGADQIMLPMNIREQLTSSSKKTKKVLILVDDNNYYVSMRYDLLKVARFHTIGYSQLYIQSTLSEALRNNRERCQSQRVPSSVIERMSHLLEPPNMMKNRWEEFSIGIESRHVLSMDLKFILTVVNNAIMNPVVQSTDSDEEKRQKARLDNLASILHQADMCCRRLISSRLQNMRSRLKSKDPEVDIKEVMRAESIRLKNQRESFLSTSNLEALLDDRIVAAVQNGDMEALRELRKKIESAFQSLLDHPQELPN